MAQRLSLNLARWGALVIILILGLSMFNVKGQSNSTNTTSGNSTNTTNGTNTNTNTTGNTTNTTGTNSTGTNSTGTNSTSNTTSGANTTTTGGSSTLVYNTIKATAVNITLNSTYASFIIKAGATSYFVTSATTPASTVPMKIIVFPSQVSGYPAFSSLVSMAAYQDSASANPSVAMTTESSTIGQTTYKASAQAGYYMLSLQNKGSTDQTITVKMVQTNNVFVSGFSLVQAIHASTDPALKTFELFVNDTAPGSPSLAGLKTYFELQSCVGNSLLYFSSLDPSAFPTNATQRLQYNVQLKRLDNPELATGTYYLYVQPVEFPYTAGGVQYATYQINTETFNSNETMPQDYYRPGNNGQVYFKVNDGAGVQLSVTWTPFVNQSSSYSPPATQSKSYFVFASPSKAKTTSVTNCGGIVLPSTATATDLVITSQDIQVTSTTSNALLNLQANTAYYIGVNGTVGGFWQSAVAPGTQSIPYSVFYYQAPPAGSSGSNTDGAVAALIAIDVILFVVCIILGAIIYKMFYSKSAEAANAGGQFAAQGGNSASASSSKNKYRV